MRDPTKPRYSFKSPGRGGYRPGAGMKGGSKLGEQAAIEALHRRLPEGATEAEKKIIEEASKTIYSVMMRPTRYSQMKLAAASRLIEEVCGKVADRMKIEDGKVTVEVVQSPKKPSPPDEPQNG